MKIELVVDFNAEVFLLFSVLDQDAVQVVRVVGVPVAEVHRLAFLGIEWEQPPFRPTYVGNSVSVFAFLDTDHYTYGYIAM